MDAICTTNCTFNRIFLHVLSIFVILAMAFPVTGSAFAQEPTPFLVVFPEWESVEGYGYPLGVTVHLEIDDPSTADITPDYSADETVVETGWGGNYAKFNFWGEDGYDLKTDDLVSLIYNDNRLTHRVRNLSVHGVDVETGSVTGAADHGEAISVNTYDDWDTVVTTTASVAGEWIVNSGLVLQYNSGGRAQIYDDSGNSTAVDWSTPAPPSTPYIWADPVCNCINGWDWGNGDTITVEVFDQGGNLFELQNPTQTYSADDGIFFDLGAEGIDLQPGHRVTMSNGLIAKELIVSSLVVKEMNPVANTISGVFDPGLDIFIQTAGQEPLSIEKEGDRWVATFETLPLDGFGEVYQPDEDGDKTGMGWDSVPGFLRYDIYTLDAQNMNIWRITRLDGTAEFNPSWSPNGKKIAHDVVYWDGSQSIYITDVKTGVSAPLEGAESGGNDAVWSPNGKWIAFDRAFDDVPSLYLVPAGGGVPTLVREDAVSADWAPSGKRLVFQQPGDGSIRTAPVNGGGGAETVIAASGANPAWSPDGNWIAYENDGNIWKVQVNVQGMVSGDPIQVTSGQFSDGQPAWSADSQTIVYHSGFSSDWDLWSVPAAGGTPTWMNGAPEFGDYDPAYARTGSNIAYASVSADGQAARFWGAAFSYDAGTWSEGEHSYYIENTYSVPEPGGETSDPITFTVSDEAPLYDGNALLRFLAMWGRTGEDCQRIEPPFSVHPNQNTLFHYGWVTDTPMTYAEAAAHFDSVTVTAYWDEGMSADLARHEIFSWSSVDWTQYLCSATIP